MCKQPTPFHLVNVERDREISRLLDNPWPDFANPTKCDCEVCQSCQLYHEFDAMDDLLDTMTCDHGFQANISVAETGYTVTFYLGIYDRVLGRSEGDWWMQDVVANAALEALTNLRALQGWE